MDGALIGWTEATDDLVRIDIATGTLEVLGDSGLTGWGNAVAPGPAGSVYGLHSGNDGPLYLFDPANGSPTEGPTLNGGSEGQVSLNSATTLEGLLLAVEAIEVGEVDSRAQLVRIETETGTITARGPVPRLVDALVSTVP